MRHGHEFDVERPKRESAAQRYDVQRDLWRARLALSLGLDEFRGKRRGVHRDLEPRPKIEQRAEMILMRMCEHEPEKIASLLHEVADVRHDEVDPRQRVVGKRNSEIDREPLPALLVAEA